MLERFLLLWLCLLSLVAYFWPATWGFDPFVASRPYLSHLISLTMLAIGWMLPFEEIREVARRWPTVIGGSIVQYTAMPAIAFAMGKLFQLDDLWMIGIVVAGCVPGAMASNVLTLVARGNVSYSVSLTTSATLLSPIAVPLGLSLCLGLQLPVSQVSASLWLTATVVVPVVVGFGLGQAFSAYHAVAQRVGKIIANLTILWVIAVVVGLNRDRMHTLTAELFAALLGLNLLGYLAGNLGGRAMKIPTTMRRALTLEVGMQNAGLGSAMIVELFKDIPNYKSAAIPTALYTFGCMFTGTVLARWWANRPTQPDGEKEVTQPDSQHEQQD